MSDLSREARAIIDAARDADAPTATDRERVRLALVAKIGAPALGTGATASTGGNTGPNALVNASEPPAGASSLSTATASGAGKGALTAKLLVGVLVIGGLGYGSYLLFGKDRHDAARTDAAAPALASAEQPPAPSAATIPSEPASPAATPAETPEQDTNQAVEEVSKEPAEDADAPKRQPRAHRRKALHAPQTEPPTPPPAPTDSLASLREEKKLISKAKEVLEAGNPALAMKVLDRHAKRFANGVLAQERAGLRVLALCDLGQRSRARAEAEKFLARWPHATMAHRVRAACAIEEE